MFRTPKVLGAQDSAEPLHSTDKAMMVNLRLGIGVETRA